MIIPSGARTSVRALNQSYNLFSYYFISKRTIHLMLFTSMEAFYSDPIQLTMTLRTAVSGSSAGIGLATGDWSFDSKRVSFIQGRFEMKGYVIDVDSRNLISVAVNGRKYSEYHLVC
jgi:hypothetical protein